MLHIRKCMVRHEDDRILLLSGCVSSRHLLFHFGSLGMVILPSGVLCHHAPFVVRQE